MCIVQPDAPYAGEIAMLRAPVTVPDVRTVHLAPTTELDFGDFGDAPPKRDPGDVEMPWIWQVLREQVYARMPRYEKPERFELVMSPVVVTSPSDTIPGVGVAGSF
jgi:hypothetical protein